MTDEEFQTHGEGIVDKAVNELMAHFDAVQVFVTRQDGEATMYCGRGKGNWYARLGMVQTWLESPTVSENELDEEDDD